MVSPQGQSEITVYKEADLGAFLGFWGEVTRNAALSEWAARSGIRKHWRMMDVMCGTGWNEEEQVEGSPVVAARALARLDAPELFLTLDLNDVVPGRVEQAFSLAQLEFTKAGRPCEIVCHTLDYADLLRGVTLPKNDPLCLVYVDPTRPSDIDADVLRDFLLRNTMADLLLRVSFCALKRARGRHEQCSDWSLRRFIEQIPRAAWVQEPRSFDRWQWTFVFFTGHRAGRNDWKGLHFYPLSSGRGQAILEKYDHTPRERLGKVQSPLTGLIENT